MFDAPEPLAACREVILEWSRLYQLAEFAELRHGYGNSDGGFGVIYPGDLDEYEIQVEGVNIPPGTLLVYGLAFGIPPGWEILVDESAYLGMLSSILKEHGLASEAGRVQLLLNN
ncbi:hypothetical protein GCM10027276_32870 [Comamonas piscis]